jgi:CRISPR-associated Csx14 family protein
MRELFPGFYERTEEELSRMWREATFVLDTNMLLNVYRYQEKTRKRFLEILEKLKERIWIPHQAVYEYQNNRLEVISQQLEVYNKVSKAIKEAQEVLEKLKYLKEKHSFIRIDDIIDTPTQALGKANHELSTGQRTNKRELEKLKKSDGYREQIAKLFQGRIGEPYKKDRLADLYYQADKRFELQIPPGWKDKSKKTYGKYGDVILWFQLLDYAHEHKKPIILVTDDVKSDWFLSAQENNGHAQPRPELVQEMLVETRVSLHIYPGNEFIDRATRFLKLTPEPDISADAKEVTAQNTYENTENAGKKPEEVHRPSVLIASLGDEPVKVSSMYDLLRKREKLNIDRMTVLVPHNDEAQRAYSLVEEALRDSKELRLHPEILEFDNADSWQNTGIFRQKLYRLLDKHQRLGDSVYLSLAGGSKNMAAVMAWIAPFFPCIKKLYHIVNKEEKDAYFQSAYQIEMQSSSMRSRLMHPNLDQLSLVEIPFERGQQISKKLRSQLLASQLDDFEKAERFVTTQTILPQSDGPDLSVTKKVIEQLEDLYKQNDAKARAAWTGLLRMSRITTLRDLEIGVDTYPFSAANFSRITLHYFTGLKAPIRPVFYTLPINSDDQIKQVVICSLEEANENGEYRTLNEVAVAPDFSVEDYSSIDTLPPVPYPADSVLIVPLGKSPMVATQLYTLLTEQEKRTIHEVVLIYPQGSTEILNSAELIEKALRKEYSVSCRRVGIPELEDIADEAACRKYQAHLEAQIERVKQEYPHCKIDLALSGGRKGMTAITISTAQNVHIPYVYHTLITDDELSDQIEEETTIEALIDTRISLQESYDRLFLHAYRAEEPYPYAHFVLFRVPVFSADGW